MPYAPGHGDSGSPGQPGQTTLGVSDTVEATLCGMERRQVLGVAQECRGPQETVRPGLVEADAIRPGARVRFPRGHARVMRESCAAGQAVQCFQADDAGLSMRRGLAGQPNLARSHGIKDDQGDRQALVLVGGMGPGVVELM